MTDEDAGFVPFRLRGGRFEQAGFPLASLSELSRYERLLIDVARGLWRNAHPGRQRLPRGFMNRMQLRLIKIEEGSVVPVMMRPELSTDSDMLSDGIGDAFDAAKELIDKTFAAIVRDEKIPQDLPSEVLPEFVRFGSGLREKEQIVFFRGNDYVPYDRAARKRFVHRTSAEYFSIEGAVAGRVTALNADTQDFTLADLRERAVPGHFDDSSLLPDFRRVLDVRSLATVVRIEGLLQGNEKDEVVAIQDVWGVEVFELPDAPWSTRLLDIAGLPKGWLDGEGNEISFSALDFARDAIRDLVDSGTPPPGIFPIPNGGVQLEWQMPSVVISLEISPDLELSLYTLDLGDGSEGEHAPPDMRTALRLVSGAIRG